MMGVRRFDGIGGYWDEFGFPRPESTNRERIEPLPVMSVSDSPLKFYEVLAAPYDYEGNAPKALLYVMAVSRESAETQVEWLRRREALPITAIVGKEHALKFNPTTGEMLGSLDEA